MTTKFISPPDPAEPLNVGGRMNPVWYSFLSGVTRSANGALNAINNFNVWAPFVIKFPEAETVKLGLDCNFDWTITDVVTQTEVGTATVQLVVNGVNVDSPMLASTSKLVQTISSGDVAEGQDISVTISSPSATCENLSISLRGVRTF